MLIDLDPLSAVGGQRALPRSDSVQAPAKGLQPSDKASAKGLQPSDLSGMLAGIAIQGDDADSRLGASVVPNMTSDKPPLLRRRQTEGERPQSAWYPRGGPSGGYLDKLQKEPMHDRLLLLNSIIAIEFI